MVNQFLCKFRGLEKAMNYAGVSRGKSDMRAGWKLKKKPQVGGLIYSIGRQ